jgi:hypothetical protein
MWRIRSKLGELFLEPRLEFVGRDRHARMAADRELKHASIIESTRAASHGYQPLSRVTQMGHSGREMVFGAYGRKSVPARAWNATMQSDPFLDFHRTAESAGYPAMLIVSVFALGLVVAPVALLALTKAVWVLVIALLSIFAALGLLAGAFGAALADGDEPPPPPQGTTSPRRIA